MSSLTQPHVIAILSDFLSSAFHKKRYCEERKWPNNLGPHWLYGHKIAFLNISSFVFHIQKSSWMTWRNMNWKDIFFYFWLTVWQLVTSSTSLQIHLPHLLLDSLTPQQPRPLSLGWCLSPSGQCSSEAPIVCGTGGKLFSWKLKRICNFREPFPHAFRRLRSRSPQGRMEPVQVAPRIKISELIRYSEEHEKRSTDLGLSQSGQVKEGPGWALQSEKGEILCGYWEKLAKERTRFTK